MNYGTVIAFLAPIAFMLLAWGRNTYLAYKDSLHHRSTYEFTFMSALLKGAAAGGIFALIVAIAQSI